MEQQRIVVAASTETGRRFIGETRISNRLERGAVMLDIWMIVMLAVAFLLVTGFMHWCSRTVDEAGGELE